MRRLCNQTRSDIGFKSPILPFLTLLVWIVIGQAVVAQTTNDTETPVVFVPPDTGVPEDRVGAGTRDAKGQDGILTLLSPPVGGLTTMEMPPLVWHVSKPFSGHMTVTLAVASSSEQLTSTPFKGRLRDGLYALDLARSGFSIAPGETVIWSVAVVSGQLEQSLGTASTQVRRLSNPAPLDSRPDALMRVHQFASQGVWYDALNEIVQVNFGGRVKVLQPKQLNELATSAGVTLADIIQ